MVRFVVLVYFLVGLINQGRAQLAEPLYFREKIHDFGEVVEGKGSVEYEFTFTNNSGRPVRIINVQASCGCTTPGWTKEAVTPGKTGFIKASFDPKGRPGYFNKSLTVTTDLSGNQIVLQIKGNVVDKLSPAADLLPVINGSLRMKATSINVGKVFINKEPGEFSFPMLNEGSQPVEFISVTSPAYIQVVTPKQLEPNERGNVIVKYNAKLKNQYGFQTDNIELKTNDPKGEVKSFSVYATIEEFFPTLAAEEAAKAAVLAVEKMEVNMGSAKPGTDLEQQIKYTNSGKKNLDIRAIQSNCSCLIATFDKKVLKPGESGFITLKFDTNGRSGTQNKSITVYSTDPRYPVQRITVSAYVQEEE